MSLSQKTLLTMVVTILISAVILYVTTRVLLLKNLSELGERQTRDAVMRATNALNDALARAIVVEKHGGALTFDTQVGKGTKFCVRFPVNDIPAADEAAAS